MLEPIHMLSNRKLREERKITEKKETKKKKTSTRKTKFLSLSLKKRRKLSN